MPGCSRNTAEFCQQNNGSGKKLKTQRPKYPRSRRRYERKRNNNRKKSGKTQKQKRKERRKRKKKERRRRQRRLRKQRNKQNNIQNNQKQSRVYKMGDYALNMDKQRENRRIQWSSILGSSQKSSKIPPFEALLSSTSSNSADSSVNNKQNSEENNNNQNTEEEFEDLSDPSSYFDEISSSDFQTKSGNSGSRRNGRKRTPLPLKEARDDLPDQNGDQRGWKRRKRK